MRVVTHSSSGCKGSAGGNTRKAMMLWGVDLIGKELSDSGLLSPGMGVGGAVGCWPHLPRVDVTVPWRGPCNGGQVPLSGAATAFCLSFFSLGLSLPLIRQSIRGPFRLPAFFSPRHSGDHVHPFSWLHNIRRVHVLHGRSVAPSPAR